MLRHTVARIFGFHDVSLSSILLLMIIASLGCDSRKNAVPEKEDRDATPSAKNTKTASRNASSGAKAAGAGPVDAAALSENRDARPQDVPLRIVSSDGKNAVTVATSMTGKDNRRYHMRELMVNPYHNELLACARTYAAIGDTQTYQTHFRVNNGRQIVFDRMTAAVSTIPSSPAKIDTKTARCLRGLYGNVVVELSGAVPMSEFYLTFTF